MPQVLEINLAQGDRNKAIVSYASLIGTANQGGILFFHSFYDQLKTNWKVPKTTSVFLLGTIRENSGNTAAQCEFHGKISWINNVLL